MKELHRPYLFSWSRFDTERNLDFHSYAWIRPDGNVLIDPLPLSEHDRAHLEKLGGAKTIVITNSDHIRGAAEIAHVFGCEVIGPAEEPALGIPTARAVRDGNAIVPGLVALELRGSKTPGELALVLDESTLIAGDFIRGHRAGRLNLLPDAKLASRERALESLVRLVNLPRIEAVLVGDGWPIFRDGHERLSELLHSLHHPLQ